MRVTVVGRLRATLRVVTDRLLLGSSPTGYSSGRHWQVAPSVNPSASTCAVRQA
jgi:hypothetical protein